MPQRSLGSWLTWAVAQESLCTKPRDIVYALLGVAVDCRDGEIKVDYTKPLEEVYGEVSRLLSAGEQEEIGNHCAIAFGLIGRWKHPNAPAAARIKFEQPSTLGRR